MALLEGHSMILYGDELYIFGGKDNKSGSLLNTMWRVSVSGAAQAAANYTEKVLEPQQNSAAALSSSSSLSPPPAGSNRAGYAAELAMHGSGAVATVVQSTGAPPSPRCYHSAVLRPPFMLIWGGTTLYPATVISPRGERVSEATARETIVFAFNLDTREWGVHVLAGKDTKCPRPRCHASLATTAHSILFYGGYPTLHDDDSGSAHVEANHWSVFEVGADALVRSNARSGSEVPMLWGHTALFAHGCLVVFGGVDYATMTETNALCLFSLDEKRWRWAEFALAPEARALHTSVLHGSNVFVYGGFTGRPDRTDNPTFSDVWRFSLNTGLWDEVATAGAHPPARSGHTAVVAQNHMVVVGGLEGNAETLPNYSTFAVLDLQSFVWTQCPIVFPLSHAGAAGQNMTASPATTDDSTREANGQHMWGGVAIGSPRDGNLSASAISPTSASANQSRSNLIGTSTPLAERRKPSVGGGLLPNSTGGRSSSSPSSSTAPGADPSMPNATMLRQNARKQGTLSGGALTAQELALREAAAPAPFGSLSTTLPVPDFRRNKVAPSGGAGIPSASAAFGAAADPYRSRSSTPGSVRSPSNRDFPSSSGNNNNNNMFAASLAMNQQQLQRNQQPSYANSRTPSAYSHLQQQAPPPFSSGAASSYQNPSSILSSGFNPRGDDFASSSGTRGSPPNSFNNNNNNNNTSNIGPAVSLFHDPRSPSNALLASIQSAERQQFDQRERERQQQQQLASIRTEQQANAANYQQMLARQGVSQHTDSAFRDPSASPGISVPAGGGGNATAGSLRNVDPLASSYSPPSAGATGGAGGGNSSPPAAAATAGGNATTAASGEMSWANSPAPSNVLLSSQAAAAAAAASASAKALEAAMRRNLRGTPPRPDDEGSPPSRGGGAGGYYGDDGNNSPPSPSSSYSRSVGFAAPTQGVHAQAAHMEALRAVQQAQQGPPPENLPVFGVRPAGGLGRSASVGLGMPPAMIDVMGSSTSPSRLGRQQSPGNARWSPGRSSSNSSLRSFHRR